MGEALGRTGWVVLLVEVEKTFSQVSNLLLKCHIRNTLDRVANQKLSLRLILSWVEYF
jgi:hypothetical protein